MSMFDEMKELTKILVAVPSMNGTSGERDIADTIEAYLREIPYFKAASGAGYHAGSEG